MNYLTSLRHESFDVDLDSETRAALDIPATPVSAANLDGSGSTNFLFSAPSDSGVVVNEWSALSCQPLYSAVTIIADTIGYIELDLNQSLPTGGKRKATEHPLTRLLAEPNDAMNGNTLKALLQSHVDTWGNGYGYIERDAQFNVIALKPLLPDRTFPYRLETGELIYRTRVNGNTFTLMPYEVFHLKAFSFNGLNGISPIQMHRQTIGKQMAFNKFGAKLFSSGLQSSGILSHPGNLSKDAQARLRDQLDNKLTGLDNAHKVMILEEAMKFEKLTINPNDAQWIEAQGLGKDDIAALYHVPSHLVGSMERSTNNNIEQQTLDFKTHCLNPRLGAWESECNRKLLREEEKSTYFFRFNLRNLLRADLTATANYYKSLSDKLEVNEIRDELGFNPLPYGNVVMTQMQNQPLDTLIKAAEKALIAPPPAPVAAPAAEDADKSDDPEADPKATDAQESTADAPSDAGDASRTAIDTQYRSLFAYAVGNNLSGEQLRQVLSPYVSAVRSLSASEAGKALPDADNFGAFLDKYCQTMAVRLGVETQQTPEERVAYELHRCRSAVARETYAACGVSNVRWAGGTLDGKVVAIDSPFHEDEKRKIYHPPLDQSCRSEIYPAAQGEK